MTTHEVIGDRQTSQRQCDHDLTPGDAVLEDRRVLKDRSDRIDRDSPVLLADQVAQDLRTVVAVGAMSGRLPSEVEMASLYGVSRVTVRRAVATLAAEGKLTVIHGRGTFIAPRDARRGAS